MMDGWDSCTHKFQSYLQVVGLHSLNVTLTVPSHRHVSRRLSGQMLPEEAETALRGEVGTVSDGDVVGAISVEPALEGAGAGR